MNSLPVFYKEQLAGHLERSIEGEFKFTYRQEFIDSPLPSLSLSLPKGKRTFTSSNLFPFFDGLIPEGWLLNLATEQLRLDPLRDRFELLKALCQQTIGAVHVGTPHKQIHIQTALTSTEITKSFGQCLICYEKVPEQEIYHQNCMKKIFGSPIHPLVDLNSELLEQLAKNQLNQSLAIAGVQKKISLELKQEHKAARLTLTDLWGRYIFKPKGKAPHLPENEHLCILLARALGIKTEACALIPTASGDLGFIARRFDRGENHEEIHQEDFCQILEKEPYKKYIGSMEQVGKVLRLQTDFPGDNLYRLYELTIFNFIIGNVDFHLKNISINYHGPHGSQKMLSPAYDLLSTDLFILDDSEESALAINGKKNKLTRDDFLALASSFGITQKVHDRLLKKIDKALPEWQQLIGKSFLEQEKKDAFWQIIQRKRGRL
jgi:serine/threonine-protein kinase HipA